MHVHLYRAHGQDRVAAVMTLPSSSDEGVLVQVARGVSRAKLASPRLLGPMSEAKAEEVFAQEVAALRAEGFVGAGLGHMLTALASKSRRERALAARRLGWAREASAVDALLEAAAKATDEAPAIAEALGEIGDPRAIPWLRSQAEKKLLSRRRAGVEALRKLNDGPGLEAARARAIERLPAGVRDELAKRDEADYSTENVDAIVAQVMAAGPKDRGLAIDTLYELGSHLGVAAARSAMVAAKIDAPHVWRYAKSVFKRATTRHDLVTFGWLAHGIEHVARSTTGTTAVVKSGLDGEMRSTRIFARSTQNYMRRAAWRYLRSLARHRPEWYAHAAAEAIVHYTDDDARPPSGVLGSYAHCYVLSQVLFGASPAYELLSRAMVFRKRPVVLSLAEAIAKGSENRAREAIERAEKKSSAALAEAIDELFESSTSDTFVAETLRPMLNRLTLTVSRWQLVAAGGAKLGNNAIVAVANARSKTASIPEPQGPRAPRPPKAAPAAPRDEAFATLWDASPRAYVRLLAGAKLAVVQEFALSAVKRAHMDVVRAASHADVLGMLASTYAPTAELGASEVDRRFDPANPDWELVFALASDARPFVRDLGIQWLTRTSSAWTSDLGRVLRFLAIADARVTAHVADLTLAALPRFDAETRRKLAAALLEVLSKPEPQEGAWDGHARLAEALGEEVAAALAIDDLLVLLATGSSAQKRVAARALAASPGAAEAVGRDQLLAMASHELIALREASHALFAQLTEALRADPSPLYEMLESEWKDTREFAAGKVRATLDVDTMSVDAILGLCDSNRVEVQDLGRELATKRMASFDPQDLVKRLAQHPHGNIRRWALALAVQHLKPGFVALSAVEDLLRTILLDVSPDRASKRAAIDFLAARGLCDERQAEVASRLLGEVARSRTRSDFERAVTALARIKIAHPEVDVGVALPEERP